MLGQKHFKGERVCFAQLGFLVFHGVEVKVVTAGRIYAPYIGMEAGFQSQIVQGFHSN